MKTINLTKALLSTLLLASTSSVVLAASDYPEDFTPQIVYQDKDYIAEHGGSAAGSTQKQSKSTASSSSSKYPDDFTPQIVYQDKDYISKNKSSSTTTTSAPKSSSVTSSSSSTSNNVASSETAEAPASESGGMSQYLIGLVALLAAGAFLFSKRPASEGSQSSASAPARNTAPGGGTGVANYLKQNDMAEPTGVAKYLDQQTIVNATGVEKYLLDQG